MHIISQTGNNGAHDTLIMPGGCPKMGGKGYHDIMMADGGWAAESWESNTQNGVRARMHSCANYLFVI